MSKFLSFFLILSIFCSSNSYAGMKGPGEIARDIRQVIGPYPEVGSDAEAKDFEIMLNYQQTRTQEQCDLAAREADISLNVFFVAPYGPISQAEYKLLKPVLLSFFAYAGAYSLVAKDLYDRPRPYISNPDITPCIPYSNTTSAYPSGHTLTAYYMAQVLAEFFPGRRSSLMLRAQEIATNRILGGVHHPSDIEAGIKLANFLFLKIKKQGLPKF